MRKQEIALADGRSLLYFDETAGLDRSAHPDRRDLVAGGEAPELRYDALLDEWVVLAAHRQGRTHLPASTECPLCPSAPGRLTEVPAPDYDVVVLENRFPALAGLPGDELPPGDEFPEGPPGPHQSWRRPGAGRCEVICFSADHDASFATLRPERVATVLEAWIDRTADLSRRPGVEHVFPFENRGVEIGVTLSHPHGQIYAMPFVAPQTARMLAAARRHRDAGGGCLWCEMIGRERRAGRRVVAANPEWVAFVPWAARWPFEVYVCPVRHTPDLPALDDAQRAAFPELYLDVLNRFDGLFDLDMPYMAAWRQAPVREGRDLIHLCLHVFSTRRAPDKLKHLAAVESGIGVWLNDVDPDRAAAMLREAGSSPGP